MNVIFPILRNRKFRETYRYVPDQIESMLDDRQIPKCGDSFHSHSSTECTTVLATDHVFRCRGCQFKQQLDAAVQKAKETQLREIKQSHESELDQVRRELAEKSNDLNDFLELTNHEIETKNKELNSLKDELSTSNETVEELSDTIRELEAANEVMKFAIQETKSPKAPVVRSQLNERWRGSRRHCGLSEARN